MKHGAKRQVVFCPMCGNFKVTLGETDFRCCGELHKIKGNMATSERVRDHARQEKSLEVVV